MKLTWPTGYHDNHGPDEQPPGHQASNQQNQKWPTTQAAGNWGTDRRALRRNQLPEIKMSFNCILIYF